MPLPNDEKLIALSEEILKEFEKVFGPHPGFRPAHAKGTMLTGTFTPSSEAASLTKAQHATQASTPVTVRFSNSTGIPLLPDNDANADPRGMAIRFSLAEHGHTDIVAHSANGFPATDGAGFLEFLRAVTQEDKAKVQKFVGSHPKALAFVQSIAPMPVSLLRRTSISGRGCLALSVEVEGRLYPQVSQGNRNESEKTLAPRCQRRPL